MEKTKNHYMQGKIIQKCAPFCPNLYNALHQQGSLIFHITPVLDVPFCTSTWIHTGNI